MAQLTWRNVEAPNLSTRDLILAGGQVAGAFDRLGTILSNREEALRKQATDAAIAQRLVLQDPNAMGALNLQGLDRRVDLRALAEADNAHRSALIQRTGEQEDLLNQQALSQYGEVIEGLSTAALNGDKAAEAKIREGRAGDPMFARALAQTYDKIVGFRDDNIDNVLGRDQFGESVRSNKAREAGDAASRALQARGLALREREMQQADQGFVLARQFADKYRLTDTGSARAQLEDDADFRSLPAGVQRGILANFEGSHKALTAETEQTRGGFRETDALINSRITGLQAEANRAENQAKDPSLTSLRRAGKYGDSLTMDTVAKNLGERMGWAQPANAGRDGIQWLMSEVPGATLADVQAAIDVHGYDPGIGKYIPGVDVLANRSEGNALKERVAASVAQRARGYTANEALDIATARAPAETRQAQIKQLREQMGRYSRAGEAVPEVLVQRLNNLLEARSK